VREFEALMDLTGCRINEPGADVACDLVAGVYMVGMRGKIAMAM
jgi:hypothetical protein